MRPACGGLAPSGSSARATGDGQTSVCDACKNGTVVEVFEWRSAEAIHQAHGSAVVQALWEEFGAACDYMPLSKLSEAHQMFAEFDSIEL